MLTLCGFPISNYHNKLKMMLIEKGIAFEDRHIRPSQDDEVLEQSPMGKVPYLLTEQGTLSESDVIAEYLEDAYPAKPLLPADPFERAKIREIATYLELHLELEARRLYGEVFFKGPRVEDPMRSSIEKNLRKSVAAFKRLAKFSPYIGGAGFTAADCAAYVHLPLVASVTRTAFGSDFLVDAGIDWKAYIKLIGERESARKVNDERKAYLEAQAAKAGAK